MYTHFRLGHTRKMKYNPCFKRGYLLAGELRHQHRKQLGICTRQCVMLLSNLISMDKSSYISHIYFFQNSICIQHQATAVHTVSSAPASPGTTLLVGEGRGSFLLGPLSQPQEYCLLLPSALPVFFRVLFTSYWAMPHYYSPLLQLINLYINLSLFKLLCGFSPNYPQPLRIFLGAGHMLLTILYIQFRSLSSRKAFS